MIQGTGAQILRFALINMFRECRSRGWLYDKVEFYITPYDGPKKPCRSKTVLTAGNS